MIIRRWGLRGIVGGLMCVILAGRAVAQDTSSPVTQTASGVSKADAILDRLVTVRFDSVPLSTALRAIAQQAQIRLFYSPDEVPVDRRVSLVADRMSVRAALAALLTNTGVSVAVSASGRVILRPPAAVISGFTLQQGTGTITGDVRDSATGAAIPHVTIHVDGTSLTTQSGLDGHYALIGIVAGEYHVSARRVGYLAKASALTLADGQTRTLNFTLNPPATKLDEVVTTALGEQRRYQVGNSIATINVDSLAPTAPITSVTDVLTARVPGLSVLETGGLTGSGEAIRIRGQSSIALQSDPIIIVDGIRQDNAPGGTFSPLLYNVLTTPSRINDIDVSQIATIDVLYGPAASTEYGTDAASGIIVITTKHAASGKPQWHASAEDGANQIPMDLPNYAYSWGHLTNGSNTSAQCPLTARPFRSVSSSSGACGVDSLTLYNPLDHAATSVFGRGTRTKYDLDVGGGTEAVRYYIAGGLSNETGALRLPPAFMSEAQALGFPGSVTNPNGEQQRSGRGNAFLRLGPTADISVNVAYLSTYQTVPSVGAGLYGGATSGGQAPDSANNYGWGSSPYATPLASLGQLTSQQTNRFTGGFAGNWRPVSWFVGFVGAGVDHGTEVDQATVLPQMAVYEGYGANSGQYSFTQTATDLYTADVRGSATAQLTRAVRAVTTVGLNLRDTRGVGLEAQATNLSETNLTLAGTPNPTVVPSGSRSATLGGYGEEQLQLSDRLFVTGALRIDAASGFGRAYSTATYPKVSVSWLAIQANGTSLRLRGAYGGAGVAPDNGLALQLYAPFVAATNGGPVSAVQIAQPGNPNLEPERSEEWEGGVDLDGWGNRVSLTLTTYLKTTQNALYSDQLGWDLDYAAYEVNIGEIQNRGFEAQLSATPVESRALIWTTTLNGSINHNLLVHLAPGLSPLSIYGQRITPGYPLYGYWGQQESYADINHDGIIEPNEVSLDTSYRYLGVSQPTRQAAFDTRMATKRGALVVDALLTYQGGYRVFDGLSEFAGYFGTLVAQNEASAPLWEQGRAVAYTSNFAQYASGFFNDGTVFRFQELSLTYTVPKSWARAAHLSALSVTGAIRNLTYWSKLADGDPSASYGNGTDYQPGLSLTTVNNDVRQLNGSAVPLARYFQFRLNVGF